MAPIKASFMPDQFRTVLKFTKQSTASMAVPGTGFIYFTPSSAFDVDPIIGSPTMAGFDQFAAFYGQYRVLASRIRIKYNNTDSVSPTTFFVMPTNATPSGFTVVEILSMRGNPFCKWKMSGLLGSPPLEIENFMTTQRIVGSQMVLWDDTHASLVSTAPANNWYWVVAWENPFGISGANQVIQVEVDVDLIFFDRRFINRA